MFIICSPYILTASLHYPGPYSISYRVGKHGCPIPMILAVPLCIHEPNVVYLLAFYVKPLGLKQRQVIASWR